MLFWLQTLIFAAQTALALLVSYLMLLTVTAWRANRRTEPLPAVPQHRFLILIPAHNEEKLLPSLLDNLAELDYPKNLYATHVVADNCSDKTAVIARQHGAIAHERHNLDLRGKGYALQWLLQRLANDPHDAIVILDADTVVSPNFLRVMDARLARGERVIQAYYAVRNPESGWSASLRYAALAVLHYLRPQGRMVLGGSAGLKGNGMVFTADIMRQHEWSASVTEDIEFHMTLLLNGERVTFAPDAVVWAEMPDSLEQSETQNVRWEQGRLEMAKLYVPQLLKKGWQGGRNGRFFTLFDAAMEHIIPPFSILTGLSILALAASAASYIAQRLFPNGSNLGFISLLLGISTLFGQVIYLLAGLRMVNAPSSVYKTLLYAPVFIIWKIGQYIKILLGKNRQGWVRTARNES
ncbi:MAG: glycosyltransferase family 2 protein [Ardenticatenaceae bacterium]|nr:glycosyltransferase family 2 protein [Ardenticatenaceae bacterium]